MMKRMLVALVALTAVTAMAVAQDQQTAPDPQQELTAALQDISAAQVGTLTVADMVGVAGRVSIAQQKVAYVRKASMASMVFPGAGQFMTGNTLGGVLFLGGDLAVMTGAMIGAYLLLPADLQFGSLNYYTAGIGSIKTAWESHSVADYLPSFGVMAGGMLLKGILGHISARLAVDEARRNIADGKMTFTPRFDFMGSGFMMGFRMRM